MVVHLGVRLPVSVGPASASSSSLSTRYAGHQGQHFNKANQPTLHGGRLVPVAAAPSSATLDIKPLRTSVDERREQQAGGSVGLPIPLSSEPSSTATGHGYHSSNSSSVAGRRSEPKLSAQAQGPLPAELYALLDPYAPVALPPPGRLAVEAAGSLEPAVHRYDNRALDKLVTDLGRNRATWRRALVLYEWLKEAGHALDDRLCTTLIRICAIQGDAMSALGVYEWMRAPLGAGGAALRPTAYTYTAAMRAAMGAGMVDRALSMWRDLEASGLAPDCRLCITYMEACARAGNTLDALAVYQRMHNAAPSSPMAPTVHAYTAAMRVATEGGRWYRAMDIWEDLRRSSVAPTGHAYAAAISACAAGSDWMRAVALFEEMTVRGIAPDVVSCTALITALAAGGEADKAQNVVNWMLANGLQPNARTYTALLTAMGKAQQWDRAVGMLFQMQTAEWGAVQPNAYTYSALLKSLGEHGQWQLAEMVFSHIEHQVLGTGSSALASLVGAFAPPPPPPPRRATDEQTSSSSGGAGSGLGAWTSASQLNGLDLNVRGLQAAAASSSSPIESFSLFSEQAAMTAAAAVAAATVGAGRLAPPPPPPPPRGSAASTAPSRDASSLGTWRQTLSDAAPPFGDQSKAVGSSLMGPAATDAAPWDGAFALDSAGLEASSTPSSRAPSRAPSQLHLQSSLYSRSSTPAPPPPPSCPHTQHAQQHAVAPSHIINEVVCGALMLAYERAGKWQDAVQVLMRALNLGIMPNTVMYNTAISAAGKAGQLEITEKLFSKVAVPDTVTYETMIAAYGIAGLPSKAEAMLEQMVRAGYRPRDYAYCGLIAAYSLGGEWQQALRVRARIRKANLAPTVHVYNTLIAACERAQQFERALELHQGMLREGVEPNTVTHQLMALVGARGVQLVESQQVTAAALSAAFAAAGTVLIQTGVF